MRLKTYTDPDLGAVAAVVKEDGEIVATAAASVTDGVYVAIDEATVYGLTGQLLPADLWDAASDEAEADQ